MNNNMCEQSIDLLQEWSAKVECAVTPEYALDSTKATQVDEKFNGMHWSRIHRRTNGDLILEERQKGSFSPSAWLIKQDFTELENSLHGRNVA